ncbi:MAG TPA: HEAT repeat domain-containing protein [Gemmataceae bacterium]|nr:HEAT repeat domain-containing protein [Gemmataceae bacterium]
MTRRRLFRIGGLLLVGLAIAMLFPQVRYSIPGWLRGDHRYRGLPTSYWSGAIRDWHKALVDWSKASSTPRLPLSPLLPRWLSMPGRTRPPSSPGVLGGGRESIPVLIELLQDKDVLVRNAAAGPLASMGPMAREAVPVLRRVLADGAGPSDPQEDRFRVHAALALWGIERRAEPSVTVLVAILKEGSAASPDALCGLAGMGPEAESAVPVLVDLLKTGSADPSLTLHALRQIGPKAKAAVPTILELARAKGAGTPGSVSPDDLRGALQDIDPGAVAQLDPLSGRASAQRQP